MFAKAMAFTIGCSALVWGCSTEPQADNTDERQEIIDNLVQAGFPRSDIQVYDGRVYVGNDAEVSLEASREMLEAPAAGDEQFRSTNLISRNLRVICVNGAAFTGKFSTALNDAIFNYNQLALTFVMIRTSGLTAGCDAVITGRVVAGNGGQAGFPSGGRPFATINIGSGLNALDVNTVEHVMTHELGHTIGMRHSDFFNRAISCGGAAANEESPPSGLGAILIPGTPSGAVVGGSLMNSCFRNLETGEFTASDRTALQFLY